MLNKSLWRGSQCSAISKWAVEEIGKNSVIPSMIPRTMMASHSYIDWLESKIEKMSRTKTVVLAHEGEEGLMVCCGNIASAGCYP
jgi:hypothetical protein